MILIIKHDNVSEPCCCYDVTYFKSGIIFFNFRKKIKLYIIIDLKWIISFVKLMAIELF